MSEWSEGAECTAGCIDEAQATPPTRTLTRQVLVNPQNGKSLFNCFLDCYIS